MFATIIAIIKAIPTIKSWVDQLMVLYFKSQVASLRAADREAIRKAIDEHDQRDLENQIGSNNAGKPSGIAGSHYTSNIPGVTDKLQDTNETGNKSDPLEQ